MKILDVNVVLPAHREDHPDHRQAREWIERFQHSRGQFAVPWFVWWSFLRLATNQRVFPVPTPLADAFAFIDAVRAQPGYLDLTPGRNHQQCLREVCERGEALGNLVPDAALAALAVEHGAEVVSFDRDFARFSQLHWTSPAQDDPSWRGVEASM